MAFFFPDNTLVIATHNAGKVKEFAQLINHDGLVLRSAGDLGLPEPEENGSSFEANARIKSEAAAKESGLASLADDSGLCVDGLDGAPGIYSARWSINKSFQPAFSKIQNLLTEKDISPDGAKAAFVCVLALTLPDGKTKDGDGRPASLRELKTHIFEGKMEGRLCFPPRGENGFGYDPIFIPDGETRSFAQMTADEKHRYSHRAKAVEALKKAMGYG